MSNANTSPSHPDSAHRHTTMYNSETTSNKLHLSPSTNKNIFIASTVFKTYVLNDSNFFIRITRNVTMHWYTKQQLNKCPRVTGRPNSNDHVWCLFNVFIYVCLFENTSKEVKNTLCKSKSERNRHLGAPCGRVQTMVASPGDCHTMISFSYTQKYIQLSAGSASHACGLSMHSPTVCSSLWTVSPVQSSSPPPK